MMMIVLFISYKIGDDSCIATVMSTIFFFFKQKTAYEMRISDWSSDVCSSDLSQALPAEPECLADPGTLPGALGRGADRSLSRRGPAHAGEIGRASCRERVCQYV